jgi:hypothetical protein
MDAGSECVVAIAFSAQNDRRPAGFMAPNRCCTRSGSVGVQGLSMGTSVLVNQ